MVVSSEGTCNNCLFVKVFNYFLKFSNEIFDFLASVAASIAFSIRHKFEPGFPCLSHSLCLLCFDVPSFSVVSSAPRPLFIDFR